MGNLFKLHFSSHVKGISVFRVIQEERSVFVWVIITVTARKEKCV